MDRDQVAVITGAQAVVECLRREGVAHVFGIPGTMNLPILDVLRDTPEIRFILTRHEQGAAFMAYGYARALNRPAVVTATEGPGVTNLATGIGAAYKGYVPVISISGAQEIWLREKDASQDIDQVTFHLPITKWAYSIPAASKIQEALRRAFRVALAEPLGPVHLDVSKDILLEKTAPEPIAPEAYRPSSLPACAPADLDRAAALISRSKRPVLVAGGGIIREDALRALERLAEATGIPVATLQYHPDAFPTTHRLALGPLGRNGWSSANRTLPQADVVIAIGAHLDLFSTQFRYGIISREAALIHHSMVATDIGVAFPVAQAVVGSTLSFVEGLAARVKGTWDWVDLAKARRDWNAEREKLLDLKARPILPPVVAHAMREALPADGVMILDAGNAGKHMRMFMDTHQPNTFMYISDWGSVGAGLPMAMGVKLARPRQPVMATVGDMGMMCNLGELETAVREKIPVVCVVFNDQGLGNERAFQNELYGARTFGVDYGDVDFAALARVLGAYGERVENASDLLPALKRALASGQPAVVDVVIDKNFHAPVVFRT
ncbi:MAG TPA: thiamine pyrophosphate-binding protein [Burkholderiales bacterium]|nr:thiamine pyrophosphate-binding protein [Burkholderiales bacterium]